MVANWENFFDPSGGSMNNSLEMGTSSIFMDIGAMLSTKWIFNPLEKQERLDLGGRLKNFYERHKPTAANARLYRNDLQGPMSGAQKNHSMSKNKKFVSRFSQRIGLEVNKTKAKYSSLRSGARMIGWGYVGLAAMSIATAALKPGVSRAAIESNNKMTSAPLGDSNIAYTQRQRALMALHESQIGIRNVISQEATSFHR